MFTVELTMEIEERAVQKVDISHQLKDPTHGRFLDVCVNVSRTKFNPEIKETF